MTHVDTMNELISPALSGASFSACRKLLKMLPLGRNGGTLAAISALVCDAITIV